MFKEEVSSHRRVDDVLVQEAVSAIELPIHVALGFGFLRIVGELFDGLFEGHLFAVQQCEHAVGQVLGLVVGACDIATGGAVEHIHNACTQAVGSDGATKHLGHHPFAFSHYGSQHGAGSTCGNHFVERGFERACFAVGRVIAAVGFCVDKERNLLLGCGLELIPHFVHLILDVGQVLWGGVDGEGDEFYVAKLFSYAEVALVSVIVVLIVSIGERHFVVAHALERQHGDAHIRAVGRIRSHFLSNGLGHIEARADEGGILLLLAVLTHIFLYFHPLGAEVGVELVKVLNHVVHLAHVVLASLRVGEHLAKVGVDEGAGVHIADFGRSDGKTELAHLLFHQSLVDEVLPNLLANLGLNISGDL